MTMGPLQLFLVAFERPEIDGRILSALADLRDAGLVRVVDLLGVHKTADGDILALQGSDLDLEEAMTYGAWVGSLLGLGAAGAAGLELGAMEGALIAANEYEYGLDEVELEDIAAEIPPGGAALMAVLEHRWAIPLRDAVRSQGGILLAQDFLNPESLIALGAVAGADLVD